VGLQVFHSRRASRATSYLTCLLLGFAANCATPGKPYLVAPAVAGVIRGSEVPAGDVQLRLTVMHRESPTLFDRKEERLYPDGEFYFDQTQLVIAGHEYRKDYRVYLYLRDGDEDRVIWRTVLSRPAVAGLIQLDCDLDRPIAQGQPCWVDNPLQHPWLVKEGERTFQRLCAGCHGDDGDGDVSTVEDLAAMPPDLRLIAARHDGRFDRAEIAEWIEGRSIPMAHGSRVMPVWGERLSEEFERYSEGDELIGATLDPVLAYLESIQKRD